MNVNTSLTTLNDFIFCPYSIYLHKAYMETDEETPKILLSRAAQKHTLHARKDMHFERLPHIASTNMRQFSRSA
ncbi:MAG: hypothetical protein MR279_01555 [Bacteroidales bacterium]|nr:hypothetical protein [Bacteroidales bacterium]MCI7466366.1 hypothetical protein [Bacteroidales bacterium]